VQITPDADLADKLNAYMHYIFKQYDQKSEWQFYNLVNVQWPTHGEPLTKLTPPAKVPLPDGDPNVKTLVNAAEETFLQQPGMSCLGCHQYATTAPVGINQPPYATSYSFMFGHASALPTLPK
jgi:hypothetical protein